MLIICTFFLYINFILQANEYFKNGQYIKAIKAYNDAIDKYKLSAVLYGNRAAAYMKRSW